METQELKSIVEALIFAADEPLSEARIRETLELENGFDFNVLIDTLNQEYQNSGRVFTIRKIAGGYQIVTQQNYASWIKKLYLGRQKNRLSHAALETLALIAFKQPISRVDIGQIRGVNSDGVIGTLLERKLITISGRSEAVGRPLLYSTTPEFLKYFGINDITDLPKPREIEELFSKEGMPEELLQALSQTDAQLSLPINADAAPEEAENKIGARPAPAIISPPAATEAPAESEDSPVAESGDTPVVDSVSGDAETATAAPAIADVDINEKVVTQLETAHHVAAVPAIELSGENEIAWISMDSAVEPTVETAANNEPAVDDLAETDNEFADVAEVVREQAETQTPANETAIDELPATANDLAAFASVTEVAAEPMMEQPAVNEFALETLAETTDELPTFANIEEVVSNTIVVADENDVAENKLTALEALTEEMADDLARADTVTGEVTDSFVASVDEVVAMVAESPVVEVQVVESYDVGLTAIESPPTEQNDLVTEVDGWLAEEVLQEEIAEPDFIKKSGDFFLEAEPQPAIDLRAALEADMPTALTEAEPIVVSDAELASVADDVLLETALEMENSFTIATEAEAILPERETPNLTEAISIAEINEASPEPFGNIAVVDLPEPTIIESLPPIVPAIDDEAATSEEFEPRAIGAAPAGVASDEFARADAVGATPEFVNAAQRWRAEEITSLNLPAVEARPEAVSITHFENEFAATPVITVDADDAIAQANTKSASRALPEVDDNLAATLRARVMGWFKRTFNKLLTLIGATGERE